MSNISYDAILIGGGHNGLVCASYLAKAGKKVLVLEAAEKTGGLGATREFAPGFKASVAHTLPQLSRSLVEDLNLKAHGFELAATALDTLALSPDGNHICIGEERITGVSDADNKAYTEYLRLLRRFAAAINPFWHKTPPMITSGRMKDLSTLGLFGLKLRMLGKADMREMMRMMFLPAQDLMDEFFESPFLKAALSWDANLGSKLAPRSPNNAVIALLYRMSGDLSSAQPGPCALPIAKGGVGQLMESLSRATQSLGVEIRTSSPVAEVWFAEQQVKGVILESGERIASDKVISNADPKTSFLKLVGARHLEVQFSHRIQRLRNDGQVAKVHLALSSLPAFNGLQSADQLKGRMIIAPDMRAIENCFDFAKYGELPPEPVMEVLIPSLSDTSQAPEGQHLMSIQVQYAPYRIQGGWDSHKDALMENILATLERYAPDIREKITASELLTPADLEQQYRVGGGHWHHAEFALDNWWMNRPTYGASQFKTPLPGFFLCGAGSHPGGGIMGAAGANAARAILKEEK